MLVQANAGAAIARYFGEVSHPIDTARVIGRTLCEIGGVVAEDGNVTRRAVPASCRGKRGAAKEPYALEILTACEGQRVSPH